MSKQAKKYSVSLAGEFYVAAELQRRELFASVTYGNAKRADVIAFSTNREKFVVIEVKSTPKSEWVIGAKPPFPTHRPWVFVHINESQNEPPMFYILTQEEVHNVSRPTHEEYLAKYKAKHGRDYDESKGVLVIKRKQLEGPKYHNAWHKITDQLQKVDNA